MFQNNFDYLDQIKERIITKCHPEKIIMFGSYAKNLNQNGSDLDLLVVFPQILKNRRKEAVSILSSLSDLPAAVDIIVCSSEDINVEKEKNYSIIATAVKEGKIIYEQH